MDYNTDVSTPPATKTASGPVILARNIKKLFSGKLSKQVSDSMDVQKLMQDVDNILEGRSLEDGNALLRGMVADLLKEIDVIKCQNAKEVDYLRFQNAEISQALQTTKEERDVVNNEYRDRVYALLVALAEQEPTANVQQTQERCQKGDILTADEATTLTIQTLKQKIESLNLEVTRRQETIASHLERMEDLESEKAAQVHKIAALERQFKSINHKRNKLGDKTNRHYAMTPKLVTAPKPSKKVVTPTPRGRPTNKLVKIVADLPPTKTK